MKKMLIAAAGIALVAGTIAPVQAQAAPPSAPAAVQVQAAPDAAPAAAALAPTEVVYLCGISYYGDYRTWIDQTGRWYYRHNYSEAKAVLKTRLSYTGFIQHHGSYDSDTQDCGEWWTIYRDTGSTW